MTWWRKSTYSADTANYVEVMRMGQTVLVRDSKYPDGAMLSFDLDEWRAFVLGMKDGQFDIATRT